MQAILHPHARNDPTPTRKRRNPELPESFQWKEISLNISVEHKVLQGSTLVFYDYCCYVADIKLDVGLFQLPPCTMWKCTQKNTQMTFLTSPIHMIYWERPWRTLTKTSAHSGLTHPKLLIEQQESRVTKLKWLKVILSNAVVGLFLLSRYMALLNQICLPQPRNTGL